jgi:hypothetical protein
LPTGAIDAPKLKGSGDNVFGCGLLLLLDSKDEWAIFFTLNGNLIGEFLFARIEIEIWLLGEGVALVIYSSQKV